MLGVQSTCGVCNEKIKQDVNTAVFDCGHRHHLSCVMDRAALYDAKCPVCSSVQNLNLKPNLGNDRHIAISSTTEARIKRRQMVPKQPSNWLVSWYRSMFRKDPVTFKEHVQAGFKLPELTRLGFTPRDAVQEGVSWSFVSNLHTSAQLLQFGFKWSDMSVMNMKPMDLKSFTWSQLKHTLQLTARDLLALNITLSEITELGFSPHQLNDLGFTFEILMSMGGNVKTLREMGLSIEDINTYFMPTNNQWVSTGFYDKKKLTMYGWDLDTAIRVLPAQTDRVHGRQIRLAF